MTQVATTSLAIEAASKTVSLVASSFLRDVVEPGGADALSFTREGREGDARHVRPRERELGECARGGGARGRR